MQKLQNRTHAGQVLAERLVAYKNQKTVVVLALPRGGVPIGFEIAKKLHLPLDVYLVRKLGVPGHEELAMGAIASGNIIIFNEEVIQSLSLSQEQIKAVIEFERQELDRRNRCYRGNKPFISVENKTIILVDDGLATGATMRAAVLSLKKLHPAKIVIAVPVGASDSCHKLESEVDEIICVFTPTPFYGVGMWYEEFPQTSDEEVIQLLQQAQSFGQH